jgi:anti-sigma factor ChrR (cupin superfamily)
MNRKAFEDEMKTNCSVKALGASSIQEADALDEHIREGCAECEAELGSFEAVAARLAFAAHEQEPSPGARDRLSALIGRMPPQPGARSTAPVETGVVSVRLNEGEWRQFSPGVLQKHLFADETRGTVTSLFRLMPGARLPDHNHAGVEECIVLEGDFRVNGEVFGPGDYRCMLHGTADQDMSSLTGSLVMIVSIGGGDEPALP